jgi:uncharacterized membrane protein
MTLRRHLYSALAALVAFAILTLLSGTWGLSALIAAAVIALVCTILYFHYRQRGQVEALLPTTPGKDDRVIPRDVRTAVIARDNGKCQLKLPGICLVDSQIDIDHKVPYTWGGSSKDEDNLQCACHPCNQAKSNKWADIAGRRLTREEYMRLAA